MIQIDYTRKQFARFHEMSIDVALTQLITLYCPYFHRGTTSLTWQTLTIENSMNTLRDNVCAWILMPPLYWAKGIWPCEQGVCECKKWRGERRSRIKNFAIGNRLGRAPSYIIPNRAHPWMMEKKYSLAFNRAGRLKICTFIPFLIIRSLWKVISQSRATRFDVQIISRS